MSQSSPRSRISLTKYGVSFRAMRPGARRFNGTVDRSQKSDRIDFYGMQDFYNPELDYRLAEWQFHYNWHRPHSALGGMTPLEATYERLDLTPFWEDVHDV